MMFDAGFPLITVVDNGIGFDAKSPADRLPTRNGYHGFRRDTRSVRKPVCGVSKSRPTRSDYDKEIAKLERELRDIDVAIAAFERLEANSSSKGKGIKTPKSSNLIQMKRRPRSARKRPAVELPKAAEATRMGART